MKKDWLSVRTVVWASKQKKIFLRTIVIKCKRIAESLPLKCAQCEFINTTVKELRQHQKIKQNGSLVDTISRLFKCWTCEKAELTLERSPNGSNTTKTIIKKKKLNLICLNSNCNTCKESFITQLLLEVHPETKHPEHYDIAPNTTIHLKTCPYNTCKSKICSWGEDSQ